MLKIAMACALVSAVILLGQPEFRLGQKARPQTVGLVDLLKMRSADGVLIVDARSAEEFKSGHIPGAMLLENAGPELVKGRSVIVYCRNALCLLAPKAAGELTRMGARRVEIYNGGWEEWLRCGLPLEK